MPSLLHTKTFGYFLYLSVECPAALNNTNIIPVSDHLGPATFSNIRSEAFLPRRQKSTSDSGERLLARTSAPDVDPADRRRFDFVAYGATPLGEAPCCDVTLVSPLTRDWRPQPSAASRDGAVIAVSAQRAPSCCDRGSQRLCVLAQALKH